MEYITVKELKKELEKRGIDVSLPLLYRYISRLPENMVRVQRKLKRRYWKVSREAIELIVSGEL